MEDLDKILVLVIIFFKSCHFLWQLFVLLKFNFIAMKFYSIVIFFVIFFTSCSQQNTKTIVNQVVVNDSKNDSITVANNLQAFGKLELFFENANYLIDKNRDTSYFYFSRASDFLIKVHQYKIIKGDSAFLKIDSIQLVGGKNIQWNFEGQKLNLFHISDSIIKLKLDNSDSAIFKFNKYNKTTIQLFQPKNSTTTFHQTITLSSFLVRSFYDYKHGTRLAFDTINFTKNMKNNHRPLIIN